MGRRCRALLDREEGRMDRFTPANRALPRPGEPSSLFKDKSALHAFRWLDMKIPPRSMKRRPDVLQVAGNLFFRNPDHARYVHG